MPDVVKRRRLELFRCSSVTVAVGQAGPGETMLVKGVTHRRARLNGAHNKPGRPLRTNVTDKVPPSDDGPARRA